MKEEIYNELLEIAPKLAKKEKKNPFKVPDGYFEALEVKTLKKQVSDAIPEGYFDNLGGNIWNKMKEEEQTNIDLNEKKKSKIIRLLSPIIMGIAASLLILLMAVFLVDQKDNNTESLTIEMVEDEELLAYIETNSSAFEGSFSDINYTTEFTLEEEEDTEEIIDDLLDNISDIDLEDLELDDLIEY